MGLNDLNSSVKLIKLPKFTDERGDLTFVEQSNHIPFDIERVYYIYNVPIGRTRGKHAHRDLQQVMIAASGQFDVRIDDGERTATVTLDQPDQGLYLPKLTWREMENFSGSAVCLVLASNYYDEDDYIHTYTDFRRIVDQKREK